MKEWRVHLRAQIDDHIVVEAENEEEAQLEAEEQWTFVEAHSWEVVSTEEIKRQPRE